MPWGIPTREFRLDQPIKRFSPRKEILITWLVLVMEWFKMNTDSVKDCWQILGTLKATCDFPDPKFERESLYRRLRNWLDEPANSLDTFTQHHKRK